MRILYQPPAETAADLRSFSRPAALSSLAGTSPPASSALPDDKNPRKSAHGSHRRLVLAFESSCDETSGAVVEDGRRVLSSVVLSQIDLHSLYGGVVPELASRKHIEAVAGIADETLSKAGLSLSQLDAVAVTAWPGLIGALLVGVGFAKAVSLAAELPLVPVHHLRAHASALYLQYPELAPPFVCLVVSGGHTQILHVRDYTDYKILGRSRDDAAGEAFDKVARCLGLPYPGGLHMNKAALGGDPAAYSFPRVAVEDSPLDMSFSGLKTSAVNQLHRASQRGETVSVPDFAASFTHAVVEELVGRLLTAARQVNCKTVGLAGGVAANSFLRERVEGACRQAGLTALLPELSLCGDNAAMVGCQGYYELLAGNTADFSLNPKATRSVEA